jgi:hypothetical protein
MVLGRGEFGIVYQVDAFSPTMTCDCPKCLLIAEAVKDHATETVYSNRSDGMKKNAWASDKVPNPACCNMDGTMGGQSRKRDVGDEEEDDINYDYDDDGADENDAVSCASEDGSLIRAPPVANEEIYKGGNTNVGREDAGTYQKCCMGRRCVRRGRPRYAVKRLREDFAERKRKFSAAIDLAVEAKFLAALTHPNIVRIRGTVDKPGRNSFMIVMDCLTLTLREKIEVWSTREMKIRHSPGFLWKRILGPFHPHRPATERGEQELTDLFIEKLMAMYDLARGMKFLQSKRWVQNKCDPFFESHCNRIATFFFVD